MNRIAKFKLAAELKMSKQHNNAMIKDDLDRSNAQKIEMQELKLKKESSYHTEEEASSLIGQSNEDDFGDNDVNEVAVNVEIAEF